MPAITATEFLLDGYPCLHADESLHSSAGLQPFANCYWCPVGPMAGRAWLFVERRVLDAVKDEAVHTLTIKHSVTVAGGGGAVGVGIGVGAGAAIGGLRSNSVEIAKLRLISARRLKVGGVEDQNAAFLVELADERILGGMTDTELAHCNVRTIAATQTYLTETATGAETPKTWQELIDSLWPAIFGAAPALPYAPHGTPENWIFTGSNGWQAVNEVLRKLGCTSAYNPFASSFSIVRFGDAQALAGLPNPPYYNSESIEHDSTDVPATVRVYFPIHYRLFGQERDIDKSTAWLTEERADSVDNLTGEADAALGTVLAVWDDLPKIIDENNNDSNTSARTARAQEISSNIVQDLQTARSAISYPGLLPTVTPGAKVKAVFIRHWGDRLCTDVIQHSGFPLPYGGGQPVAEGQPTWPVRENVQPPNVARKTFPTWPRVEHIVQIVESGGADNEVMYPNIDGLFDGKVKRIMESSMETIDDCWILVIDEFDTNAGVIPSRNKSYWMGRLYGNYTSEATSKPLYVVSGGPGGSEVIRFRLTANKAIDSNAAAVKLDPSGTPIAGSIIVVDTVGQWHGFTGYEGWAVQLSDAPTISSSPAYEIIFLEAIARFVGVTLTGNMTAGVSSGASVNNYWGAAPNGKSPGSTIDVYDRQGFAPSAVIGDKLFCVYDEFDVVSSPLGKYVVVSGFSAASYPALNGSCGGITGYTEADVASASIIEVSKESGLGVYKKTATPTTGKIVLKASPSKNNVLQSKSGDDEVTQRNCLTLDGWVLAGGGTAGETGWFISGFPDDGDQELWIGRGSAMTTYLKIRFPNAGPDGAGSVGQHLVVEDWSTVTGEDHVQLKFTTKTLNGTFTALHDAITSYTYTFADGLLVTTSNPDLTYTSNPDTVTVAAETDTAYDFCP